MYRLLSVMIVVTFMAIWPFASLGEAQEGEGRGSSSRGLSDRIEVLERQIDRLEDKISRLEKRLQNAQTGGDGASGNRAAGVDGKAGGGKEQCPGEWRKVGGGWVCTDYNAK